MDHSETFAGTIDRGKASGRLVPIPYMLNEYEVYSYDVKSSYEMNGYSIDIITFRRKGNEINRVPFE